MNPIIEIKSLSKKYKYGEIKPYYTLRETLNDVIKFPMKILTGDKIILRKDEFWALKDINLEVNEGEVLGVIGSNGAGKSTLLKVLSRITPPTQGEVILRGRVASLLEVGTGFHQELTGRENIYLNGAILGMSRKEIKRKFDEIVDFSGVEKFLDTPIKHYSSGMRLRLAFSVAAHLEPEILLIDEVLSVGDVEFQQKSLGKMNDIARSGRTILFVSHNMQAIRELCDRVIYLYKGELKSKGETEKQIQLFYKNIMKNNIVNDEIFTMGKLIVEYLEFKPNTIHSNENVSFKIKLTTTRSKVKFDTLSIVITNITGNRVGILDLRSNKKYILLRKRPLFVTGEIKRLNLIEGFYDIGLYYKDESGHEYYRTNINKITIIEKSNNGVINYPASARGVMNFEYIFKVG